MSTSPDPVDPVEAGATGVLASNDPAPPEVHPEPSTPGEYLRAQREKIGMSVVDLAARLRMGTRQVEALERSDYKALPTGTFLRGFVRNYAKAVQADTARAMALLEQTNAAASVAKSPGIVVASQNIKVVPPGGQLATPRVRLAIVAGVVLLLAGAVWYWWEFVRPHLASGGRPQPVPETVENVAPPVTGVTAEPPKTEPVAAVANPVSPVDESKAADTAVILPTLVPAPAPAAKAVPPVVTEAATAKKETKEAKEPKASTAPASGANQLGFTFSGESWVEVIDANGKTIVSRRYKAGEAEEATGRAPFSIVIGNAQVTRMAYNGKEVDLAPHTRVSVARVTVK